MTASNPEKQDAVNEENKKLIERLRRVLGSCSINFYLARVLMEEAFRSLALSLKH